MAEPKNTRAKKTSPRKTNTKSGSRKTTPKKTTKSVTKKSSSKKASSKAAPRKSTVQKSTAKKTTGIKSSSRKSARQSAKSTARKTRSVKKQSSFLNAILPQGIFLQILFFLMIAAILVIGVYLFVPFDSLIPTSEDVSRTDGDVDTSDSGESSDTTQPPRAQTGYVGYIYLVLDDAGNEISQVEQYLNLPIDFTLAVLPKRPYTREAGRRAQEAGREVILHQPMEPKGIEEPGAAALFTWMPIETIQATLEENLKDLPMAKGINNHMGSAFTEDVESLKPVMEYLKTRNLYFLDSLTTADSQAVYTANGAGIPNMVRDAEFLDNEDDYEQIKEQLLKAARKAKENGRAIAIGHVWSKELYKVLRDYIQPLKREGIGFRTLTRYLDD
jgi:polysaccharide deacetylase 2 family uncharacterized protein YibQ